MPDKSTPLTVHEAQVTTATVEIRVLTIGGKQMTLSVFRQLPREGLVRSVYDVVAGYPRTRLVGVPWGHVNYHTRECPEVAHLHLVGETAGRLVQTEVPRVLAQTTWERWARRYYPTRIPEDAPDRERWWQQMASDWEAFYDALERLPQLYIAV